MTDPYTPESPFIPPLPPGAANGPTFDEYRWSRLVEENKHNVAAIAELGRRLDELDARHDPLIDRVQTLDGALAELYSRVMALEDQLRPATKPRDSLSERIVAFLESHPDLKFTAISIDENLDGTGRDISDRLKTLARNGRIRIFAEEKRRPFYQALEQPAPVEDQPTS